MHLIERNGLLVTFGVYRYDNDHVAAAKASKTGLCQKTVIYTVCMNATLPSAEQEKDHQAICIPIVTVVNHDVQIRKPK